MKRAMGKSNCPVNFALEVYGDPWSMLIVRDIVLWGKRTYGEFLDSDEGISTNILANRLASLEKNGILVKTPDSDNKRKIIYSLTEKGLDLAPIMLAMAQWSLKHNKNVSAPEQIVERICNHKAAVDIWS